jgi:hypothetical protein
MTWTYFLTFIYIIEVFDVGLGNLAISKLLAEKNVILFAIYILVDVLLYVFGRWCHAQ